MPRKRGRRRASQKTAEPVVTNISVRQKVLDELYAAGGIVAAKEAGDSMSDTDLRVAIKGTEVALAYLEGRGRSFDLVTSVLRRDLSELEQYRDMRKHKENRHG
jgi:hypothetical protein